MLTALKVLGLALLAALACAHPRSLAAPGGASERGDIHEGPCRVDAECPAGQRCGASRGHMWNAEGEIVGDHVRHFCHAPAVDAGAAAPAPGAPTG